MDVVTKYPPGPTYKIPGKLLRQFIHDPTNTLTNIARKYGDISYFKLGRQQHVYLINNPDYIEKVLIHDHRNFKKGKRLQTAKAVLGEGLVTSEGDLHNRQRRLIQPVFHPKQIISYSNTMTDYATHMRDRWKDGEIVDISEEMMRLTLDIICKSLLNYDIESEAQEIGKALTTVRKYSKRLQSPIGHVLDKIPVLPAVRGAREAKKELDSLVYQLIADRRRRREEQGSNNNTNNNGKSHHEDLLSRLMEVQDSDSLNNNQEKMSDKQVRDKVMTIFIAGHETTANALTWTFYLLSQNQAIETELHNEINSVLGDGSGEDNIGNRIPTA